MIAGPIGGFLFIFLVLVCLIAMFTIVFRHFYEKRKSKCSSTSILVSMNLN